MAGMNLIGGRSVEKGRFEMNRSQYQKAADTVVGALLETLESFNLPESQINTVRRVAWAEIDKQFGRFFHE